MPEFLTLTLNPSLDISAHTPNVTPGPKLRLSSPVVEPGGGGVNVARAAAALGGRVRALVALGGANGARLQALLEPGGIDLSVFDLPGETRESLSVTETGTGQQYRFVMPGPTWSDGLITALRARVTDETRAMEPGVIVVVSGSQPPGVGDGFVLDLCQDLPGARVVVDTSGAALSALVQTPRPDARPFVLRMDHAESQALAGFPLPTAAESVAFAQALRVRGVADVVVLARGSEGSVLASADHSLLCVPPSVPVRSKVGAGDSFMGGFVLAMARGQTMAKALQLGTAAAAAAVMTPSSALCLPQDVTRLRPLCSVIDLSSREPGGPA